MTSRNLAAAQWTLRIVLAVQCTGLAMKLLWGEFETESDIYGWLFFDLGWEESTALRIEDIGTKAFFACGMLILVVPLVRGFFTQAKRVTLAFTSFEIICLLWMFLWQGTISILHAYRGGSFMSEWAVAAHAVRIFSPLALVMFLLCKDETAKESRNAIFGEWILRLAILATFATHGAEAIGQNSAFIDLLIGSANNLLRWDMSQSTAAVLLYIIGAIDIVLAATLLFKRWRWVAVYLAFWGFVTASSRITEVGLAGMAETYPETLIRAANGGAPLALCILWVVLMSRQKAAIESLSKSHEESP